MDKNGMRIKKGIWVNTPAKNSIIGGGISVRVCVCATLLVLPSELIIAAIVPNVV